MSTRASRPARPARVNRRDTTERNLTKTRRDIAELRRAAASLALAVVAHADRFIVIEQRLANLSAAQLGQQANAAAQPLARKAVTTAALKRRIRERLDERRREKAAGA